ncbi:uncharacterized protein LACBIDRAFT_306360 [Laccaria bicolor S238N-H82]|uniref:Predicted protein n=1 Tax=Laccaria bicolor (strain S238N-H82 / ATCC MYA-4686) TaxID=486041 RepID=B0DMQ3_LACBS|nr:uncharacterized protein LACBIDRAFT_306360 [Laccaria bicolor S238N-H82]EDR04095.1 predicted protein [Laccaria bicolor S238N-H82]|eukprot:XP_001885350.1 predicted protein [Laccaria bicolor S238N-H82]
MWTHEVLIKGKRMARLAIRMLEKGPELPMHLSSERPRQMWRGLGGVAYCVGPCPSNSSLPDHPRMWPELSLSTHVLTALPQKRSCILIQVRAPMPSHSLIRR